MRTLFTSPICLIDGSAGRRYVRNRLASLLSTLGTLSDSDYSETIQALYAEPSDDASEENDAIEILNDYTDDKHVVTFDGGDVLVVREENDA